MGIAVVTGANSGIGLATALRLARDGHTVFAAVRDLDSAATIRDTCINEGLEDVHLLRIDVRDDHWVDMAFDQVSKQAGEVEILVNSAGIGGNAAIEDADLDSAIAMMDTNFFGTLRCLRAALPAMRARGGGCIVNLSSLAARASMPTMGIYAATKAAVEAMSEALAQEVAPYNIRVVVIEPGTILTPMLAKAAPPPERSPYLMHHPKVAAYFTRVIAGANQPDAVADAIARAIDSPEYTFRHPVGWETSKVLAGRAALTDEQAIAMGALDLDEWKAAFSAAYGFEV